MKKLLALLLALVMVIGMVACGAKEEAAAPAATEAAPAATEAATEAAPEANADKPMMAQPLPGGTIPSPVKTKVTGMSALLYSMSRPASL